MKDIEARCCFQKHYYCIIVSVYWIIYFIMIFPMFEGYRKIAVYMLAKEKP